MTTHYNYLAFICIFCQLDDIFATFEVKGKYGDILRLIQWVYHQWLPESGYETTTMTSYTIFKKNHFLSKDELFEITYCVPIKYV